MNRRRVVGVLLPCVLFVLPSTNRADAQAPYDAPEPDHLALFKLYMASNGAALASDDALAWEHYLLTAIPSGPDPKVGAGTVTPECMDLLKRVDNEVTRQSLLEDARARFSKALDASAGEPTRAIFKIRTQESLGEYDEASGAFELQRGFPVSALTQDPIRIAGRPASRAGYQGPALAWCSVRLANTKPLWIEGFRFAIGSERPTRLPMAQDAAERFIDGLAKSGRSFTLESVVEVGPMSRQMGTTAPARLVAARAINRTTGAVFHTFAVSGAPAVASSQESGSTARPTAASATRPGRSGGASSAAAPPAVSAPARQTTPTPSTAGSGPQPASTASFTAPPVDYAALFKLYVAANADALATNDVIMWENYLLFSVPAGTVNGRNERQSAECTDLDERLRNEITRQSIVASARAQYQKALPTLKAGPTTGRFLLKSSEVLGPYDIASGTFPLTTGSNTPSVLRPEHAMPIKIDRRRTQISEDIDAPAVWCDAPAGFFDQAHTNFSLFRLQVLGREPLARLPMARGAAESFINQMGSGVRLVNLEVVVDVGPIPLQLPLSFPQRTELAPARVVAARALDVKTGAVLHTFAISPSAAPAAAATAKPPVVATPAPRPAVSSPQAQPQPAPATTGGVTGPATPKPSARAANTPPAAAPKPVPPTSTPTAAGDPKPAPPAPPPAASTAKPATAASTDLSAFAGSYATGAGEIVVTTNSAGQLTVAPPNQPTYDLRPGTGNGRFVSAQTQGVSVEFRQDRTGNVNEMLTRWPGGQLLAVRVSGEALDAKVLASLAGNYSLSATSPTLVVAVTGEGLTLDIPGQPTYRLIHAHGLRFSVASMLGVSVEFTRGSNGLGSELVLRQPNGNFPAYRR